MLAKVQGSGKAVEIVLKSRYSKESSAPAMIAASASVDLNVSVSILALLN